MEEADFNSESTSGYHESRIPHYHLAKGIYLFPRLTDADLELIESVSQQELLINYSAGFINLSRDGLTKLSKIVKYNNEHFTSKQEQKIFIKESKSIFEIDKKLSDVNHSPEIQMLFNVFCSGTSSIDDCAELIKPLIESNVCPLDIYALVGHWVFYHAQTAEHYHLAQTLYQKVLTKYSSTSEDNEINYTAEHPDKYYNWRNYLLAFPLSYTDKSYLKTLIKRWKNLIKLNPHDPQGWEFGGDIYLCLNEIENKSSYQKHAANCYRNALACLSECPEIEFQSSRSELCWKIVTYPHAPNNINEKLAYITKKKYAYGIIIYQLPNYVGLNNHAPDPRNDVCIAGGCGSCSGCSSGGANNYTSRSVNNFFNAKNLTALINY